MELPPQSAVRAIVLRLHGGLFRLFAETTSVQMPLLGARASFGKGKGEKEDRQHAVSDREFFDDAGIMKHRCHLGCHWGANLYARRRMSSAVFRVLSIGHIHKVSACRGWLGTARALALPNGLVSARCADVHSSRHFGCHGFPAATPSTRHTQRCCGLRTRMFPIRPAAAVRSRNSLLEAGSRPAFPCRELPDELFELRWTAD